MAPAPPLRAPTDAEIRDHARANGIELTESELDDFSELAADFLEPYARLDELREPTLPTGSAAERETGYRPGREENPLNAWVTRCRVRGREDGPLAGYDVALKDNVALAGVRLTAGSRLLEGYVPDHDATVVRRLLDAGASVVGKANMDDLAQAASGELSATGPVYNPVDPDHLAGGSSSGAVAVVGAGEADVAVGTDQGGSVRIPAAWCGCVGLKPTYGLVPYTGIVGGGHTLDHAGPIATSVRDCARVMDVVAGSDPLDHRQGAVARDPPAFEAALSADPDVTVAAVAEGFGREGSDPAVDDAVRGALAALADAGADVRDVEVPAHPDGLPVWSAVITREVAALVQTEGLGEFVGGHYDTQFLAAFAPARRTRADEFPPVMKLTLILADYLAEEYHGRYYAKAQNLRRALAGAYDEALAGVGADVLAMPTALTTAIEADPDAGLRERVDRAFTVANTAPFNVTGHPAVSVPCGEVEGLPVGLMLVGERGADATALRAARAVEASADPPVEPKG